MNPASKGVAAYDSKQPQYEQNYRDRPKHSFSPERLPGNFFCHRRIEKVNCSHPCDKLRGTGMRLPIASWK